MKRILPSLFLIFAITFAAEAGPTGETTRFESAFQKALAALTPEERSLLESPILNYTDWIDQSRKVVGSQEEEYARRLPRATTEMKEEMTATLDSDIESLARLTCFLIVRREQLARNLGYTKWLPAGTPLLEVFSLSASEIEARGLEISPYGETRSLGFTLRNRLVDVHINMKTSLENTRMALLLPNDMDVPASFFRLCEHPYGEVCVAETAETPPPWSRFKFARSNVFVELRGPTEAVESLAGWIDKGLQEQIATSGKVVEEIEKPVVVLTGKLPAHPQRAAPVKTPPLPRGENVLVFEEPLESDKLGAVVPDGAKSVTVRIRVLDPRVTKVFVSNGVEHKTLEPVNGQITATFPLVGTGTTITAQAHTEPSGDFHGIIGVKSIAVMTESNHRAAREMFREIVATPAPKK